MQTMVYVMARYSIYVCATALAAMISFGSTAVKALTMQECSAKYKAAKSGGTLNGKSWNQFRKDDCGSTAAATPPATPSKSPSPKAETPQTKSNAVFPTAVAPTYSKESAGKARMHTCLDQYRANKATGANGGLTWIQKGGGYYSECNKRLKS
jgi:hypothetical protein